MPRSGYPEAYVQVDVWHDGSGPTEKLEQVRVPSRGTTRQDAASGPLPNESGEQGWELAGVAALEAP